MKQCFTHYGRVYRTGGDEFTAVLHTSPELAEQLRGDLDEDAKRWSQENGLELSISTGCANHSGNEDLDIYQLAKLADQRMYEAKDRYYQDGTHERRKR